MTVSFLLTTKNTAHMSPRLTWADPLLRLESAIRFVSYCVSPTYPRISVSRLHWIHQWAFLDSTLFSSCWRGILSRRYQVYRPRVGSRLEVGYCGTPMRLLNLVLEETLSLPLQPSLVSRRWTETYSHIYQYKKPKLHKFMFEIKSMMP